MKEKNRFYLVVGIFVLLVLIVPISMMFNSEASGDVEDVKELIAKDELSLVYLGSATCPWCEKYNPVISGLSDKEDFDYLYIDMNTLTQSESDELKSLVVEGDDGFGVPHTMIVGYGEIIDSLKGFNEEDALYDFLNKNGFFEQGVSLETDEAPRAISGNVAEKIEEIFEGEEMSLIYLGSGTCPYCSEYNPIIKSVATAENFNINYVDLNELNQEETFELVTVLGKAEESFGVPLTLLVQEGRIVADLPGLNEESSLRSFLASNNFIDETNTPDDNDEVDPGEVNSDELNEELVDTIESLYNGSSREVLYLGANSCPWCVKYNPIIKEASEKNNFEYLYVDLDAESFETFMAIMDIIGEDTVGTPYTSIIGNGQTYDVLGGMVEEDVLVEFLKTNKVLD